MGCNCGKGRQPVEVWTVTYPSGQTVVKASEAAAKIAAAKVNGATYQKTTP